MGDADITQMRAEAIEESRIRAVQDEAAKMPKGKPGDCDLCGEWSGRLVNGACAPCRDKYKLP